MWELGTDVIVQGKKAVILVLITIKLFATLRDNRFKTAQKEYAEGTSVADVLHDLKIEKEKVSLIFINGRPKSSESQLFGNDTLSLFPPVGGG